MPSECFSTCKAAFFEPHLKSNFEKAALGSPNTFFQSKQSSCRRAPTPLLWVVSEDLAQRRWFGGTKMEGDWPQNHRCLIDNRALCCQFSTVYDLVPICAL